MKFPYLDKLKLSTANEDRIFPSWDDLNNKIRKFEHKVDQKVKKVDDDTAIKLAAEECFLVLPPPFDTLAEKIYDSSRGSARARIKQSVAYFRQLQNGGATEYNHLLTSLEQVISAKDIKEIRSHENLQKIYGILIGRAGLEKKSPQTLTEPPLKETEESKPVQAEPSETNIAAPQEEEKNSTRLEDNRRHITKILLKTGLPLVLRSEQDITIQEEIKNEIVTLLEENVKLMGEIQESETSIFDDEYLLRTGNFHYLQGNLEKSIELFDQVLKMQPTKMTALNNKGVALHSSGNYEAALDCFNKALNSVPENVHVLCNKGISLYKNAMYTEALECFDLALKLDANYVKAITFKGHTLYRLGKNEDALSCYNKVIRLEQNNSEALYNKACLCSLKGDEYGALTSLERAIRFDPSWKEAAIEDCDLERVKSNQRFSELVQLSN